MIEDELTVAGEAVRALARQRQAEAYLLRVHASAGTDQMPLPPRLDAALRLGTDLPIGQAQRGEQPGQGDAQLPGLHQPRMHLHPARGVDHPTVGADQGVEAVEGVHGADRFAKQGQFVLFQLKNGDD